ncbi:MAG: hypothetical protein B6242_08890, partial [Anaerolineaceae bacterium 4572_78]
MSSSTQKSDNVKEVAPKWLIELLEKYGESEKDFLKEPKSDFFFESPSSSQVTSLDSSQAISFDSSQLPDDLDDDLSLGETGTTTSSVFTDKQSGATDWLSMVDEDDTITSPKQDKSFHSWESIEPNPTTDSSHVDNDKWLTSEDNEPEVDDEWLNSFGAIGDSTVPSDEIDDEWLNSLETVEPTTTAKDITTDDYDQDWLAELTKNYSFESDMEDDGDTLTDELSMPKSKFTDSEDEDLSDWMSELVSAEKEVDKSDESSQIPLTD